MEVIAGFLGRMLPAMAAALPVLLLWRFLVLAWGRKRGFSPDLWYEAGLLLFLLYLAGLAAITILPRGWQFTAPTWGRVNLRLFRVFSDSLWEYRAGNLLYPVVNILGNVVMFLPLGFFPALLWGEERGLLRGTLAALAASCTIEFCQLFQNRGTDVDDLWLNALGGALGYGCFRLLRKAAPGGLGRFRRKKPEGQTVPR